MWTVRETMPRYENELFIVQMQVNLFENVRTNGVEIQCEAYAFALKGRTILFPLNQRR